MSRFARSPGTARPGRRHQEQGFTIVEMMVSLLVIAVVFAALAQVLGSGLRTVAVTKTRANADMVATQAIEDLQRFSYDYLGICSSTYETQATVTPPAGLSNPVYLTNCNGTTTFEQPCTPVVGSVPLVVYDCTVVHTVYHVSRFIAWGDYPTDTQKRLAVVVDWTDPVGNHEISQQSSLRAPSATSVIGALPPEFTSVSVNPNSNVQIGTGGGLYSGGILSFAAGTTGLGVGDLVTANFLTLQAGVPTPAQITLTSPDGTNWSGSTSGCATCTFAPGSQFFYFTAQRVGDGKTNSKVVTPSVSFVCAPSDTDPDCTGTGAANPPAITTASLSPATVYTDVSGALDSTSSFTISATTTNVTSDDTVAAMLNTLGGEVQIDLVPSGSCPSSTTSPAPSPGFTCTWSTTVSSSNSYRYPPGNQTVYLTAAQVVSNVSGSVDVGSTAAGSAGTISIQ